MNLPCRKPPNPYIGASAFHAGTPLYGRAREVRELTGLLIAERIVLLYSPSGAGKTSLINAALIPELSNRERFRVLPVVRVGLRTGVGPDGDNGANPYVRSVIGCLEDALPAEARMGVSERASLTFSEYLSYHLMRTPQPDGGTEARGEETVLIFDQFEEILTVDRFDREAKHGFFEEVGAALRSHRSLWALFSLREDYVAGLDEFAHHVPSALANTFRLNLLGAAQAREAIREPARALGVEITDVAACALVDNLRAVPVEGAVANSDERHLGDYVEPMHLQVVCHRLWERMPAGQLAIGPRDLEHVDVDEALEDHYAEQVAAVAASSGTGERAIREWFERRLITPQRVRSQVLRGSNEADGLGDAALDLLVDSYLVRKDTRAGRDWYELAHDRLIGPVLSNNAAWRRDNLNALAEHVSLWESRGRSDDLLARGKALRDAFAWSLAHPASVSVLEREFLQRSQKRHRNARLFRVASVAAGIGFVASLALALYAWAARSEALAAQKLAQISATREKEEALRARQATHEKDQVARLNQARALAADSKLAAETSAILAFRLSLEAKALADTADVRGSMLSAIAAARYSRSSLSAHVEPVHLLALSSDGRMLASAGIDSTVRLWDPKIGIELAPPLRGQGSLRALALSGSGRRLATARDGTNIEVRDPDTGEIVQRLGVSPDVFQGLAFSAGENLLAAASRSGVTVWDVETRKSVDHIALSSAHGRQPIAFRPASADRQIAFVGSANEIIVRDIARHRTARRLGLPEPDAGVSALVFSPNGRRLAAVTQRGGLVLWDVDAGKLVGRISGSEGAAITSAAFSPDGAVLATGQNRRVRLWDATSGSLRARDAFAPELIDQIFCIVFAPDGRSLLVGTALGDIVKVGIEERDMLRIALDRHRLSAAAFMPEGHELAASAPEGLLRLSDDRVLEAYARSEDTTDRIAVSGTGDLLAWANRTGTIVLFNKATDSKTLLRGHRGSIRKLAFHGSGRTLVSLDEQKTLWRWDTGTGAGVDIAHDVEDFAIGPATGIVATLASPHIVLHDLVTGGRHVREYSSVLADRWRSIAFAPKEDLLYLGNQDSTIEYIDLVKSADARVYRLGIHGREAVSSLAISHDGVLLASGSRDGSVLIWDLETGKPLGPSLRSTGEVRGLGFSRDRARLLSTAQDVRVWNIDFRTWEEIACSIAGRGLRPKAAQRYLGTERVQADCPRWALNSAHQHALANEHADAGRAFARATELALRMRDHLASDDICWFGALDGHASIVLPACEHAVAHAPSEYVGVALDSLAVAKAVAGRTADAIAHFEQYLVWWREQAATVKQQTGEANVWEQNIELRRQWIVALKEGREVFTPELMKQLMREATPGR